MDVDAASQRDTARAREIAAGNIIQATAVSSLQRAHTHKIVAAVQKLEFVPGELVDVWYEPSKKDTGGWRGPAKIKTVNDCHFSSVLGDGNRRCVVRSDEAKDSVKEDGDEGLVPKPI